MSGNSIRDTFFEECEELLENLVEGLSQLEESADDEVVNSVFRAVHSIKGGAGAFGLERVVAFAHTFETVMDRVRDKELSIDETLLALFHKCGDQLNDLVASARDETDLDASAETKLIKELEGYLGAEKAEEDFVFDAITLDFGGEVEETATSTMFEIEFVPERALYANGHEPLRFLDALADLGPVTVALDDSQLPDFDAFDPEEAYLGWKIQLETSAGQSAIEDIFEFVEGLCHLSVSQAEGQTIAPIAPLPDPVDPSSGLGVPALEPGGGTDPVTAPSDTAPQTNASPAKAAESKQAANKGPKPTLRVDLDRVDRLINTVGELIINQAMVAQRIQELELPTGAELTNELEAYKLLARDIQEGVMAIRAQPVKPLFQRMSRIVREASEATEKKARLVTVGDSTEVDKTVIERLADPLTHMIRNAVDHGLEKPEARIAAGKQEIGTIRLSAAHRSGSVFIEISDDGAGLNRAKILEKALEKGLVDEGVELTDSEIDNLLFLPGFSTAGTVSNLSGRGVGMDVVKTAVQALGGRVSIMSTPGQGTVFTIILPLTLAVMDGFVVSVEDQTMVVPITSILETLRPPASSIHQIRERTCVKIRGSYIPIVDVAYNLGLSNRPASENPDTLLLVASEAKGMIALSVSGIFDQRQVVVKSLESNYAAIQGISAATILGDGKIALILDPEEIIRMAHAARDEIHKASENMEAIHA